MCVSKAIISRFFGILGRRPDRPLESNYIKVNGNQYFFKQIKKGKFGGLLLLVSLLLLSWSGKSGYPCWAWKQHLLKELYKGTAGLIFLNFFDFWIFLAKGQGNGLASPIFKANGNQLMFHKNQEREIWWFIIAIATWSGKRGYPCWAWTKAFF